MFCLPATFRIIHSIFMDSHRIQISSLTHQIISLPPLRFFFDFLLLVYFFACIDIQNFLLHIITLKNGAANG